MFLARTNDNQRNARGKSDAVPQQESHKRRHTNYHLARRARRKSEVGTARCAVRGDRSAMSLPKKRRSRTSQRDVPAKEAPFADIAARRPYQRRLRASRRYV